MGGDLVIGGQLGNYLIESVIGRGGMSVVYRATHARLGTSVALKVLAPELSSDDNFRERFLREAKMAAGIDHANVVPIHDMGMHEGSLYIVMRYIPGGDLRSLLTVTGPLDADYAVSLLMPIARALDAAHACGLVHRDVKPGNILTQRSPSGEVESVYLSDFGIAKSSSFSGLTHAGGMVGTVQYMAPEQVAGEHVSAQTDEYALAEVFFECVTGHVPAERSPGRMESITSLRPELPDALDAVMAKALSRSPHERYASCEQFLRACGYVLQTRTSPAAEGERAVAAETAGGFAPAPSAREEGLGETVAEPFPADDALEGAFARSPRSQPARGEGDRVMAGAGPSASAPPPRAPEPRSPAPETQPPQPIVAGSSASLRAHGDGAPPPRGGSRNGGGLGGRVPRPVLLGAGALIAVLAVAAVVLATKSSGKSASATAPTKEASLGQVPTNHVTGSGSASVVLKGDVATITVTTTGLDYNEQLTHALHIHGGGKGQCPPESAARLHNGHLSISTTDGINYYGSPVQALTKTGDTSTASILAFSRYPSGGNITYKRTITLPAPVAAYIRQDNAVIVVHGVDYDHSGLYSGVLDRSELNKAYPGTATAPALCGTLFAPTKSASTGRRGPAAYTATLRSTVAAVPYGQLFVCHPPESGTAPAGTRRRLSASATAQGAASTLG